MKAIRFTEDQLAKIQSRIAGGRFTVPVEDSKPAKRSKYGNVKTVFKGMTFDSKHEADCYAVLLGLQAGGLIRNLQRQVSFPIVVEGKPIQRWRCDFWYFEGDRLVIADAKSEHTASLPAWKRTRALFEALYGVEVTIL
jgi:hypothetical protein